VASNTPAAGRVVAFALDAVGVDPRAVPMDEILGVPEEYLDEHEHTLEM
jgi:hypothetical protein